MLIVYVFGKAPVNGRLLIVGEVQLCVNFPLHERLAPPTPTWFKGQLYMDIVAVITYYTIQNLLYEVPPEKF